MHGRGHARSPLKLLKSLLVADAARAHEIQLLQGDLTNIPPEHAIDVLIVSAFPYEYSPVKGTLIGDLSSKGISVHKLAKRPEANLRGNFGCWISPPIDGATDGLLFRRILCFEPAIRGRAPEVVGDIFRALAPFVHGPPEIRSLALPVVATGKQNYPISKMLPALLHAAYHHLEAGLPIDIIKIVVRSDAEARDAMLFFKKPIAELRPMKSDSAITRLLRTLGLKVTNSPRSCKSHDVFISYSRKDKRAAVHLSHALTEAGATVFLDEGEIEVGASWQQNIWEALEQCSRIVALYSPDFIASKVCQDEFNAAMILRRRTGDNFIFPILVRDVELPAYMEMLNYRDCRVSNQDKIRQAATVLAAQVTLAKTSAG